MKTSRTLDLSTNSIWNPFVGSGDFGGGFGGFGGGWWEGENNDHYFDATECALATMSCAATVLGYVGAGIAFAVFCPETFGLTCLLAVLGYAGATLAITATCADAGIKCQKPKRPRT